MRLSPNQASAINRLVKESLGSDSEVWLFGSRADDLKRGGDVDLYIEAAQPCALEKKLRLMSKIQLLVGLRKVDLLVKTDSSLDRPIYNTAKSEGIHL
ncbi:nucleotidyltransferase domain-containing protein [Mariprofundus ferrooxydans]|nr:nucleotidyltransferase domain-containing protein [Mariprofundus ferrooxydans]